MSDDHQTGIVSGERFVVSPPPRPRTLGAEYLHQAVEALRDAGSSDSIYTADFRSAAPEERHDTRTYIEMITALQRRVSHSRSAMLYAAFAAEANINEFLAKHYSGEDLKTLDRLPTVEKYVLVTRLTLGKTIFERGADPIQTVGRLFKLRDSLVHPKPERSVPTFDGLAADPTFNPTQAAKMILAVAETTQRLVRVGGLGDGFDMGAHMVLEGRSALLRYAERATKHLPHPDAPPAPEFFLAIAADPEQRKTL